MTAYNKGNSHQEDSFLRYHRDIYLPDHVMSAATDFLPPPRTQLPLSMHYLAIQEDRRLPPMIYMQEDYDVIYVTVFKDTMVVYSVMVRFRWNRRSDFAMVLEGNWEVVTGFWANPKDRHATLDPTSYVACPECADEPCVDHVRL